MNRNTARPFFRMGLALWLIQTLLLASGAWLLMFTDARWVDLFARQRLVRNFMANPVQMTAVEAFGVFCRAVGIAGLRAKHGSFLDTVWGGTLPLFIGVCLLLLFLRGLFRPWRLFQ